MCIYIFTNKEISTQEDACKFQELITAMLRFTITPWFETWPLSCGWLHLLCGEKSPRDSKISIIYFRDTIYEIKD